LTMRECQGAEECLARLEQAPPVLGSAGRLHIGWGSFRNLDIAAARCSASVLLFDVNLHQFRVWDAVGSALAGAGCADAFVDAVAELLPNVPRLRQFGSSTARWLAGDTERPGSWLYRGKPERYDHVRRLFQDGAIAWRCLDLRGDPSGAVSPFQLLSARVARAQMDGALVADTLYVSNIPWMLAQPVGFFGESHGGHLSHQGASALGEARRNLTLLAPRFAWIVSAMRLRDDAAADNLQWRTELLDSAAFLADGQWEGLAAPAGANTSM